jgi:SAM-dependent methyltransferase
MGLKLKRTQFDKIVELISNAGENTEHELRFKQPISLYQFQRLIGYLAQVSEQEQSFQRQPASETLDISGRDFKDARVSITSIDEITEYCKTGYATNVSGIRKVKNIDSIVDIPEYHLRFQTSEEVPLPRDTVATLLQMEPHEGLLFRMKKRISFLNSTTGFRIDCTAVKMPKPVKKLYMSMMSSTPVTYEVEIEAIKVNDKQKTVIELFKLAAELLKVLDDTDNLLTSTETQNILEQYHKLVHQTEYNYDEYKKAPKKYFVGPQPISLDKSKLKEGSSDSIFENYTVTHKADGERALCFCAPDNKLYLINNRMSVKDMNVKCDTIYKMSLFDCEVILSVDGKAKNIYLFDSYIVSGENVCQLPFDSLKQEKSSSTRLGHIRQFVDKVKSTDICKVVEKKFWVYIDTPAFYKVCNQVILEQKSGATPFRTDGLIFTPLLNPVGGKDKNDKYQLNGKTWGVVYKWKPPSENSIDFLVQPNKDEEEDGFVTFDLFVGNTAMPTRPWDFLTAKDNHKSRHAYIPVLFKPISDHNVSQCKVPLTSDNIVLCANKDVIETSGDCIVEMSWDTVSNEWKPMRVRTDKTEMYKATKNIGGAANDYLVAQSIWQTIVDPVKVEHLIDSKCKVPKEYVAVAQGQYYNRKGNREESDMFLMNMFHNQWIKKRLLNRYPNTKKLLDLGCGKGGDISKWMDANYKIVVGLDLFDDNITNPFDGAYARLGKNTKYQNNKTEYTYVFLQFDVSQVIDKETINNIPDAENRTIAQQLWGHSNEVVQSLSKYYKIAASAFDIVSCQFAVHYFFQNDKTLENFCKNVSSHLRKDGIFVGTCFDGASIAKLLQELKQDETVHGRKGINTIWSIKKLYEKYEEKKTGQRISVYIQSINQAIDEYLVDFNLLEHAMNKHGLRLLTETEAEKYNFWKKQSHGLFSDLFNDMIESLDKDKSTTLKECLNMSEAEKQFSFLNRWFAFIKK